MYYKLYKERSNNALSAGLQVFEEFNKIYQEHGVNVIGVWKNKDDSQELFFMTAYDSEDHYLDFVEEMKTNEKYQSMSQELGASRESIEVFALEDALER